MLGNPPVKFWLAKLLSQIEIQPSSQDIIRIAAHRMGRESDDGDMLPDLGLDLPDLACGGLAVHFRIKISIKIMSG